MRKQVAAANWKMNLTYAEAQDLLKGVLDAGIELADHQQVVFAVPAPYLDMAAKAVAGKKGYAIAAQNCHQELSGAYTGEISVNMLKSMNITYCLVGHSERREYFAEDNAILAKKTDNCLAAGITAVFCCGEPLEIREKETQNEFVAKQLEESLFHLSAEQISTIIIAYEPIWAIGTGKTATNDQAQEMQAYLREVIRKKYDEKVADSIPILYGGSVKGSSAPELFACPDVDGGLVGGASLKAAEFCTIISSLK